MNWTDLGAMLADAIKQPIVALLIVLCILILAVLLSLMTRDLHATDSLGGDAGDTHIALARMHTANSSAIEAQTRALLRHAASTATPAKRRPTGKTPLKPSYDGRNKAGQ